ncbi:hypothetical protein IMZ48_38120 [Candidatus Bathyarchaeota archaeon]|nr:hypothetical protein [Candidatus Bathyarchaeota archaeon]
MAFGNWEGRPGTGEYETTLGWRYRYADKIVWKGGVGAVGDREVARLGSAECF